MDTSQALAQTTSQTAQVRNGTVPLTDLVRASVRSHPVSIPVTGSLYTRLEHVRGVPPLQGHQGHPLSRLKALDALIARIRGSQEAVLAQDMTITDPLERQEELLAEMTEELMRDLESPSLFPELLRGFLVDLSA
ncbi:hypothetical protein AU468_04905 [Alkalispirochaeta sphaeroplastigenens]|uniref:Uncharacterized protein n=1 Tax=Alkalispirochaeta sphaeroplastigenens TaxID=1187066 RepID=A0A2S4JVP4_9SPIO|nr:hypothetical protein [Alkalispirochaeta sphaeroplastigenens]POR03588.1 hypothetical protein AU468_04905 [Alkalispirochaeta sphaeroplastigenens]